jgi:hypothetical protein
LLLRFLTYCDGRGKFSNHAIDPDLLMRIDSKMQPKLEGCRDHRNLPEWFERCLPICESFNLLVFPEIFAPQYEKYALTLTVLKNLMRKFELPAVEEDLESENDGSFKMLPHKKTIKRLQKKKKLGGKEKPQSPKSSSKPAPAVPEPQGADIKIKFGSQYIIKSQGLASLNLETFTNEFLPKTRISINPYDIGKYTQMNEDQYKVIIGEAQGEVVLKTSTGFTVTYPRIDEVNKRFDQSLLDTPSQSIRTMHARAYRKLNGTVGLLPLTVVLALFWALLG